MTKAAITLHRGELQPTGVALRPIGNIKNIVRSPHRDDHYMFIVQAAGSFLWEVDFKALTLTGPSICFIAPGQVHHYIDFEQSVGTLVFVDAALLSGQSRDIFDAYLNETQSAAIKAAHPVFSIIPVLEQVLSEEAPPLRQALISSLVETLAGFAASALLQTPGAVKPVNGQKYRTLVRFKQLLRKKHKEVKQVKAYATLLHITPLYLNELLKETTGFSASYWINHETLLEAKRLLHYTALDVKEIAYELGYEDHAYFSRFFRKHTGMPPSAFRRANHYLSNNRH